MSVRVNELTPAQRRMAVLRARGLTIKATAHEMGVSEQTVKNHTTDALTAFSVNSFIELMAVLGWVRIPEEEDLMLRPSRIVRQRV